MNNMVINRNVSIATILMIIYCGLMVRDYIDFVGISYPQFRFQLVFNHLKMIEASIMFVVALIFSLWVAGASAFTYAIYICFFVFFLVPGLITFSLADQLRGPLYCLFALVIAIGLTAILPTKKITIAAKPLSNTLVFLLIGVMVIPFLLRYGFYFNVSNLLLEDVYETRGFFDERTGPLINYLYNWLVKALLPLLIVYFLIRKKFFFASFSVVILMYLYVISGNKIVYITTLIVLFFYLLGKSHFQKIKYFLLALTGALAVMPLVDLYYFGNHTLQGTFVMRMFFLPAHLNHFYFDFFEDNKLFFSESKFFKYFFEYPYDKPVGFVISDTYFNAPLMNANNGIISDGFMNLGYPGVVLNIIIVCVVFLFFKANKPDPRYFGIFVVMIFLFLSAPMLSMFLTSGIWILMIMSVATMGQKEDQQQL